MGTFLFYLLKSAFCLILFYVFYRALLSRSTFFRFNRLTLLVGMSVCVVLPLMEFTTEEEHLFHTPFQVIHRGRRLFRFFVGVGSGRRNGAVGKLA